MALNRGVKECKNELIARMDSDDISDSNRLMMQYEALNKYNCDIIGSNISEFIGKKENIISYRIVPELDEDIKRKPTEEKVPSETFFLIRKNDNKIVGMINIRLELNENLKKIGGHIGYSIRPEERKKGYNKINLYLGLKECQKHGIKEVLMDCDKNNIASAKTMQALNGVLIKEWYDKQKDRTIQYYIIDVDKSLENNKEKYEVYIEE